jgi:hypothetical protein
MTVDYQALNSKRIQTVIAKSPDPCGVSSEAEVGTTEAIRVSLLAPCGIHPERILPEGED